MNKIYGVSIDGGDGPVYKGYFTSENDALKYAALLGKCHEVNHLTVDDEYQLKRARNGLKPWRCCARSDSAGADNILSVSPDFDHVERPSIGTPKKRVQAVRHPLMRPWDDHYNNPIYTLPSCDELSFVVMAASYEAAHEKATLIRTRWLAGETIDALEALIESV